MGLVIDTIWTIGSTDNDIVNDLTILKKGQAQHGNLIKLVQNCTKILDEVRSILKETNDLSNDINYKLKPKYVKIREFNDTVLSLADEKGIFKLFFESIYQIESENGLQEQELIKNCDLANSFLCN